MKKITEFIQNELHKDFIRGGVFLLFFGLFMQYAQENTPKQCVSIGILLILLGALIPRTKKILSIIVFLSLFFCANSQATTLTIPNCSEVTGGYILASHWNGNCNAISTFVNNNNIDGTTNIATSGVGTSNIANLAVTDAKIAGITTAGKVNGSALTQVNNIPGGAGTIPIANIPVIGNANLSGSFGAWATKTIGTIYQATTDGFAIGYFTGTSANPNMQCVTDSSATPTTVRAATIMVGTSAGSAGWVLCPVRKNDYFQITYTSGGGSSSEYFLPVGS